MGLGPGGLTFGAYAPGCATVYLEALLCRGCSVRAARARMYMDSRALASSGFKGLGFRASLCAGLSNYPCFHGATPLPGICEWQHAQEAKAGLSSTPPPAVRHHRLPPKLLPVRVQGYALNSHLRESSSCFCSLVTIMVGPPHGGLQGAPESMVRI